MKEYATGFYKSKQWQHCRQAYAQSRGWLCEDCLANGKYVKGEIVHHIEHITPENIEDPTVTLDWNNLRLVCRECHAKEHNEKVKRYVIDENGNVQAL